MDRWSETIDAVGKRVEIKCEFDIEDALPDFIAYFREKGVDLTSELTPGDKKHYFDVSKHLYLTAFNFCKKEGWSIFITMVVSVIYLESKIDKWILQDREGSVIDFGVSEYNREDANRAKAVIAEYTKISAPKVMVESFDRLAVEYHKYLSVVSGKKFTNDQTKLLESILYTYFLFKYLVKNAKIETVSL